MKTSFIYLPSLLFAIGCSLPENLPAAIRYDATNPKLVFAAQEVAAALKEAGNDHLQVTLSIKPDESSPEAFELRTDGQTHVEVIGSDGNGAMYGGLELADRLKLSLPIENVERVPFVKKRGIKFNIPWDARTPSYDDTGDNARKTLRRSGILKASGNPISMTSRGIATTS